MEWGITGGEILPYDKDVRGNGLAIITLPRWVGCLAVCGRMFLWRGHRGYAGIVLVVICLIFSAGTSLAQIVCISAL